MKRIFSHPITKTLHTITLAVSALLFLMVLSYGAFFIDNKEVRAGSQHNMSGWAWSDNIGWISFNCTDTSTCDVDYGVNVAIDGDLSGYAWSDNIGWVTFNEIDLSDCPIPDSNGDCKAELVGGTALQGWARALSNGDEWDGWISLSDITLDDPNFEGFVWDASDISEDQIGIGWIDFDPLLFGGVIFNSSDVLTVTFYPANLPAVSFGENSTLTWSSSNATECTGTGGLASWIDGGNPKDLSGDEVVGPHTIDTTVYWLTCTNAFSSVSATITVFIETSPECSDEIDNDEDGQTDWPEDTSCDSADGDDESIPVCGNDVCEDGENPVNCSSDCGTIIFEEF